MTSDGGPALFRLVRYWSRRWATGPPSAEDRQVQHVLAVTAVDAAGAEPTIGAVAHQLGVDQSGASRLVGAATAQGYLTRVAASGDRRRAAVALTDTGRAVLADAQSWQRAAFSELTAAWDPSDQERFAGYLQRLADEAGA